MSINSESAVELVGGPYCGAWVPWTDNGLTPFVRLNDVSGVELYVRESEAKAVWSGLKDAAEGAA